MKVICYSRARLVLLTSHSQLMILTQNLEGGKLKARLLTRCMGSQQLSSFMELHQNQERLKVSYEQKNTRDNELSELEND